jgi:hypothetical protein
LEIDHLGTQDHKANRIVNSQTVTDLHRTAEPSLRFDGSNDRVDIGTGTLNSPAAGTMSAWVRYDSLNNSSLDYSNHTIIGKGNVYFALTQNSSSKIVGYTYFGSGGGAVADRSLAGTTTLVVGKWYHVAYSWTSSSETIYLNGVEEATRAGAYGLGNIHSGHTDGTCYIGSSQNSGSYFHGEIKDVRIHNRALADTEVAAAYNGESTPWKYADASSTELLPNPSMETEGSWTYSSFGTGSTHAPSTTQVHGGTYSNKVVVASGDDLWMSSPLTGSGAVTLGKPYRYSAWVYCSVVGTAKLQIAHNGVSTFSTANTTINAWEKISMDFTAANTSSAVVYFHPTSTAGTHYIDDLSFVPVGEVAAYTPQSINDKWYDETSNANHGTIAGATSVNRTDHLGPLTVESDSPVIQLRSTDTTATQDQTLGAIQFYSADTDGTPGVKAEIQGVAKDAHPDGRLSFKTASGGNAPVEHFRIGADGEVQAGNKDTDNLIQVARVWAETITTNATDKYYRITHNLGSRRVVVSAAQEIGSFDFRSVEVAHRAGDWLNAASGNTLSLVANGSLPNYTTIEFASAPGALDFDITVIG